MVEGGAADPGRDTICKLLFYSYFAFYSLYTSLTLLSLVVVSEGDNARGSEGESSSWRSNFVDAGPLCPTDFKVWWEAEAVFEEVS